MTESIEERLFASLSQYLRDDIDYRCKWYAQFCESPIEIMLGVALVERDHVNCAHPWQPQLCLTKQEDARIFRDDDRLLMPQYKWEGYRIDWVIRDGRRLFFIECDGHNFHERTKHQAARDRQRDREIQQAGIPILRFTGSEIFADPVDCADSIYAFVSETLARSG